MTAIEMPQAVVSERLAELYVTEAAGLTRALRAQTRDRPLSEDITQDAFARVHQSWSRIEDPARAPAYLRSVAYNLVRSHWRQQACAERHASPVVAWSAPSAEDGALVQVDRRLVAAALANLPARQRECLVLRYYAGCSDTTTAASLGISANSVKTHIRRGLATLRATLGGAEAA